MSNQNDFKPYVPAEKITPEITITSIIMGILLAVVFGAANAYLGLRVGMTVSASIPAAVIAIMGTPLIGYVSSLGTVGQSAETAASLCWLVVILYSFSAICQFVGVAVIYNIDKKTLAKMTAELAERRATAEVPASE